MNDQAQKSATPSAAAIAGKSAAIGEAHALLDHYEPATGKGRSLSEPSQGEARRMLACIRALLAVTEATPALHTR